LIKVSRENKLAYMKGGIQVAANECRGRYIQVVLNEKGRELLFWSKVKARVHYIQEGVMLQVIL
jgi:hypothetical protein